MHKIYAICIFYPFLRQTESNFFKEIKTSLLKVRFANNASIFIFASTVVHNMKCNTYTCLCDKILWVYMVYINKYRKFVETLVIRVCMSRLKKYMHGIPYLEIIVTINIFLQKYYLCFSPLTLQPLYKTVIFYDTS